MKNSKTDFLDSLDVDKSIQVQIKHLLLKLTFPAFHCFRIFFALFSHGIFLAHE